MQAGRSVPVGSGAHWTRVRPTKPKRPVGERAKPPVAAGTRQYSVPARKAVGAACLDHPDELAGHIRRHYSADVCAVLRVGAAVLLAHDGRRLRQRCGGNVRAVKLLRQLLHLRDKVRSGQAPTVAVAHGKEGRSHSPLLVCAVSHAADTWHRMQDGQGRASKSGAAVDRTVKGLRQCCATTSAAPSVHGAHIVTHRRVGR